MVELSDVPPTAPAALGKLEAAWRLPVGAASPLWFIYAGAASAGVAYWWASRWTRPVNLEAMLGDLAPAIAEPVVDVAEAIEEPLAALAPTLAEAAPEPIAAPVVEALAEPIAEPEFGAELASELAPDPASDSEPVTEALPPVASEFVELAAAAPAPRKRASRPKPTVEGE